MKPENVISFGRTPNFRAFERAISLNAWMCGAASRFASSYDSSRLRNRDRMRRSSCTCSMAPSLARSTEGIEGVRSCGAK